MSFHRPFLFPPGRIQPVEPSHKYASELDAVHYGDWCIGQFMAKARSSSYFDRTMFVFVADHPGGHKEHPVTPTSNRVPFLIVAPKLLADRDVTLPQRVSAICSQTDVAPTILALLGGAYEHCFFGSSVLDRPAGAGRALMQRSSGELTMMDGNGELVLIPFDAEPNLFRYTPPNRLDKPKRRPGAAAQRRDELARQAVAILQTANTIFERGGHRLRAHGGR
jgi:phosphoglycerol transferase MdoB-like AlkP superfamily enzyme